MSPKHNDCKIEVSIEELIKVTESAGNRTRWATIALILATVLIGIGFYNSTDGSFANERLKSLKDFENTSINNENDDKPLLDSYFGKNDFKDTKFKVGLIDFYQEEKFDGLRKLLCNQISPNSKEQKSPQTAVVGKYLYDNFNKKTKNLVDEECSKDFNNASFLFKDESNFKYLTADLNRVLYDKYLYDERRFDESSFTNSELQNLIFTWTTKPEKSDKFNESSLESEQKKVDIVRLNRLLLEAVFPNEINPSENIIPSSESIRGKELAKYIAFDEKVQFIEIPFFDSAIDVNDLGAFGGISLIIILLLLRFSLSREIKNLNLSFRQSFFQGKLDQFYHLLAMRQVLTIPEMAGETKNQTLSASTKWIYLLPFVVILLGVIYDYYSIFYYKVYEPKFVFTHLFIETLCVLCVLYLSLRCMERQIHIDEIWEDFSQILSYYKEQNPISEPSKATEGNTISESLSSEYCKEVKEYPKELLEIAFKNSNGKSSASSNISNERSEVLDTIKKRFAKEPAPDGNWFVNLFFNRQNITRLIPIDWVADKFAESKIQIGKFYLYSVMCIISIFILIFISLMLISNSFLIRQSIILTVIFIATIFVLISFRRSVTMNHRKQAKSNELKDIAEIEPIKIPPPSKVKVKKKPVTRNSTKQKTELLPAKEIDNKNPESEKEGKKSDGKESDAK